jgi:NTE family protein
VYSCCALSEYNDLKSLSDFLFAMIADFKNNSMELNKVGLALGGGGILGAAHIGTLKAIKENDIEIKYIAGTSIGALVGALYAFGKSWEEIYDIALKLKWLDITSISLSKYGLLTNENLAKLMIEQIGDRKIEDAPIPLAMLATNASNGKRIVLNKGSVADAVMASTCIPGLFKPVAYNNDLLIDGGIVENVPINTVKQMGAEFVIGVDLNTKRSYAKPENILDVMLNSFHFIMEQSDKFQTVKADLLIKPDLSSYNRSNTKQVPELMKTGYKETIKSFNILSEQESTLIK